MAKLTLGMSVLAGVTALFGDAVAESTMVGPTYIGHRAPDPEDETFAYSVKAEESYRPLAFIGPARYVGAVTGDPEKDTVGYRPLLAVQERSLVVFARARLSFQMQRRLWLAAGRPPPHGLQRRPAMCNLIASDRVDVTWGLDVRVAPSTVKKLPVRLRPHSGRTRSWTAERRVWGRNRNVSSWPPRADSCNSAVDSLSGFHEVCLPAARFARNAESPASKHGAGAASSA